MTEQVRRCPNGHPVLFSGDGFCEVCGAPLGAASATVPPPGWGQPPQAPVPPQGQPGWGAPPPMPPQGQQPMPPAWDAAPPPMPQAPMPQAPMPQAPMPQAPMPPQGQPGWGAPPPTPQQGQQPMPPTWGAMPPQGQAGWGQPPQGQQPPPGWGQPPQGAMPPGAMPPGAMPQLGQPGWGAPPSQPWMPQVSQGQPAWGAPPPKKKGGGCGKFILILLLLVILGAAAYVLVAKPSWSPLGATATASPVTGLATPKPSGPASSSTPAPLISVEPGGSGGLPTPAPSASSSSGTGSGDLQTCRADKAGITVSYPAGWYTVTGYPDWNCMLFDPKPIKIVLNADVPAVAIQIAEDPSAYTKVVKDFETNTAMYALLDSQAGTVDGLDATAIYIRHTGNGLFAKGTEELVVVVDRGTKPTLTLAVIGMPGAAFDAYAKDLGTVITNISIDQ